MERKLILYAVRTLYGILVAVEVAQSIRKIRDAFRGIPRK